ncbi:tripartite tricarboxylate transporter TctB family protein [Pararhizobium sp. IMCC21322]|uniref:tripartite tricarboxylate transporter TctB family protein n=1 Tax=Pararhizobium sp. IMCC21322 TaxID=3067903 RepID=UPI0027409C86|nr:tripartite tricarboxylate transporter TctB family protein [Pararhizobium sp. IMCC21322]
MKFNDAISGALFLVIGIFAFIHAGSFKGFPGVPYGPEVFPRIIAVMMGGGGLLLIVSGLRRASNAPWLELADWARQPRSYGLFTAIVGAVLIYILASDLLGFLLTGSLILTGLFRITRGPKTFVSSAILAVGITVLIHLLFAKALRVPLPFGIIEHLLVG